MTANVKGMSVLEYLGQGDYWLDTKSDAVFEVKGMAEDRRVRAAAALTRMSTALIIIAEGEAACRRNLPQALRLAGEKPREWMIRTALYRALYPAGAAPDEKIVSSDNHQATVGVQQVSDVRRIA
jgi:hypothetical protein